MEDYVKTEIIERTLQRVYSVTLKEDNGDPETSRIGGKFSWPVKKPFPEGMIFLAQINFAEVPNSKILPTSGLLQFFISDMDDESGLVVFHEVPDAFEVRETEVENTPIIKPAVMEFKPHMEAMSYTDYRFPTDDESAWDMEEFQGGGTKLLGYPFFCQGDPREYREDLRKYDTLLFQLDSEEDYTMWGDVGVANFFINGDDLRRNDFSDVYFTWDCM